MGSKRRTRSFAVALVIAMIGSAFVLFAPPAAAATTYSDYAVYGEDGVFIGVDSIVTGLVGARNNWPGLPGNPPFEALHMNGNAEIQGDANIGADVNMQNGTVISGTLTYGGTLTRNPATSSIGTEVNAPPDLPPLGSWPPAMQWPAPGAAAHCAVNHAPDFNATPVTLNAGNTYGTIQLGGADSVTFNGPGDIFIDRLVMGNGAQLSFTGGPVRLFVCQKFQTGTITSTPPAGMMPGDFYTEVAGIQVPGEPATGNHGFEISSATWIGNVFVPTKGMHIGSGSSIVSFTGYMWANFVDIEHAVTTTKPATKSGFKFHDQNANTVWDAGEPGLPNFRIYVDLNDNGQYDVGEPFDITAADGSYLIEDIPAGMWKVREEFPPGETWICSYPTTADAFGCYHEELFADGVNQHDNLFGNFQQGGAKTGLKIHDLDGDGIWEPPAEFGLAGWTIYVDYNDNGQLDANEPFGVSDATGFFTINDVAPGTWKVREVQQAGWACTIPATTDAFGCYIEETFVNGQTNADNLFGNTQECKWCTKGAVLSQVWQNMEVCCAIPDILVDLRLPLNDPILPSEIKSNSPATGSIQAAVDYVNANGDPSPGDGEIFIAVTAMDCGTGVVTVGDCAGQSGRGPGGSGTQNVDIVNMNPERLNVFGCSVTLNAADVSKPVVTVRNGIGKVTVLDIHVQGSNVEGYYAENNADLVVLKNSRAQNNDIGYRINDTNVQLTGTPGISNNRIGVQVEGDGNTLRDNNHINANTSDGILLTATADANDVRNNDSDGNQGNGIHVLGKNNDLLDNNTDGNGKNGVLADVAEGASGNNLHGMAAENNTLQGIKACGQNDNGQNTGVGNGVSPQVDFVCAAPIIPPGPIGGGGGPSSGYAVPDDAANKVFTYDGSWAGTGSFSLAAANDKPSDGAVAGSSIYVLDTSDKKVYRYSAAGALEAASKVLKESGGGSLSSPTALAIDGDQVFVADGSKKKIYRYSLASLFSGSGNLSAAAEFAVVNGNNKPGDLALDATYVYSVDESTKQVYRQPRAGGAGTVSKTMKGTGGANLGNPSGAVISGGDLYVSDFGKDTFYRYSLASLFGGTGNLNASAQWAAAPGNGDARGL